MMSELMQIYKQQDVEKLNEMSMDEDGSIAAHADLMLYQRNANWAKQFPVIVSKKTTLFAVGAAHLGGKKGVLQLMREQGYVVRAIKN